MVRRRSSIFTLIVMLWACVWCCCTPAAAGPIHHTAQRPCCTSHKAADQSHSKQQPCDECPFVQVRSTMMADADHASAVHFPDTQVPIVAIVDLVSHPPTTSIIDAFSPADSPPPVTLISLHCCLQC